MPNISKHTNQNHNLDSLIWDLFKLRAVRNLIISFQGNSLYVPLMKLISTSSKNIPHIGIQHCPLEDHAARYELVGEEILNTHAIFPIGQIRSKES